MIVAFSQLPDTSRVWIYQASRSFSTEELIEVEKKIEDFLDAWTAHGADLKSGYEIKYNRFIILGLDQDLNTATGCSIDASVHFIQQLEKEYHIDLMDRMNVSFKQGPYVAYKTLVDFKKMAKNKSVSPNTIVFNNLVTTIAEYKTHWEVPAKDSWHNRFLN